MLALVVDDSRMARYVLGKMLREQGIDVDAVESAEEALGYLCGKHPDMIFMDHTMPGMNGIQALRAIKNDPKTTTIPIMMYTSKEGEVYMSKARQAGAAEVLPKQLKPEQLQDVLHRQQLLPSKPESVSKVEVDTANAAITAEDTGEDLLDVARAAEESLASKQFQQQIRILLQQNRDELLSKLEQFRNHVEASILALSSEAETPSPKRRKTESSGYLSFSLVALFALGTLWLGMQFNHQASQMNELLSRLSPPNQTSQSTQPEPVIIKPSQIPQATRLAEGAPSTDAWIKALELFINRDNQFPFGAHAYNDSLAALLDKLSHYLEQTPFTGNIELTSHLGIFCTVTDETGTALIPATELPASQCNLQVIREHEAIQLGMQQSPEFQSFLQSMRSRFADRIRVVLNTAGTRVPKRAYPDMTDDLSAGEWNRVAYENNRVDIVFKPTR
jgi:CheY-like chemotaxis protein